MEIEMEWKSLLLDGYERIPQEVEEIIGGLLPEDLNWQPGPEGNSIGWIVWHLARVQDAQIADLMGEEQVYIKEKWYAKFNRPARRRDTGFGATRQEVAEFQSPDSQVLLEYVKATTRQSLRYINSISAAELDRVLDEPWFTPRPTVGVRLTSILADGHQHTGEASYIAGLRKAGAKIT
jgi:hypothetical protein